MLFHHNFMFKIYSLMNYLSIVPFSGRRAVPPRLAEQRRDLCRRGRLPLRHQQSRLVLVLRNRLSEILLQVPPHHFSREIERCSFQNQDSLRDDCDESGEGRSGAELGSQSRRVLQAARTQETHQILQQPGKFLDSPLKYEDKKTGC